MLKTNNKEEFKKLFLQIESLKNQLENTFDLKEKNLLKMRIENIFKKIDVILDEYNKGE